MRKTIRRATWSIIAALAFAAAPSHATTLQTIVSPFTGDPIQVQVTLDDAADPGNIVVTVSVVSPGIGDLRGLFLNISDDSLLPGLSATGADVTSSAFSAAGVIDLGNGANLNGAGSPCPCDMGIEIGTQGIGTDDISSTTFTLSHSSASLTVALFAGEAVGVRVTSVDVDGERTGSSKLGGVVPEPSTLALAAFGLVGLAAAGRRQPRR